MQVTTVCQASLGGRAKSYNVIRIKVVMVKVWVTGVGKFH